MAHVKLAGSFLCLKKQEFCAPLYAVLLFAAPWVWPVHALAEGGSVQTLYQDWLLGASPSDPNLLHYAIGGALDPSSQGAPVLPAVTTTQLSITAIIRINDTNLYVIGQSTTDLTSGTWSAADVIRTVSSDQTGAVEPGKTQRQIFTTPLGAGPAKFLRLQTTLQGPTYQDDFSTNPGALNGRTTASGFGNWTTDNAFQVGGGRITINSNTPNDYHAASFSLPSLGASDTLSLSITLRPSGANFMGFGFTPNSNQYVINNGYGWLYYEGLGSGNPNIQIFTGASTAGAIYSAELTNPALNFDASLPTTFQYTYSAAAKTLSLSAVNGTTPSTLLNNADVSAIPLEAFNNFSLQFQGQDLGTDTNPAYIDSLKVEIIPAHQAP
jgi:hypothetical protein